MSVFWQCDPVSLYSLKESCVWLLYPLFIYSTTILKASCQKHSRWQLYSNEKNGLQQLQMESCQPIIRLRGKKKKITIELKNITNASDNTSTLVTWNTPRKMALLSDVVIFFSSIEVLIPNGQFLDCVAIAFSERYNGNGIIQRQLSQTISEVARHMPQCV